MRYLTADLRIASQNRSSQLQFQDTKTSCIYIPHLNMSKVMARTFINKLGKRFITLGKQKQLARGSTRKASRNNEFCDVSSDATELNSALAVKITKRSDSSLFSRFVNRYDYIHAVPHTKSILSKQRHRRNCDITQRKASYLRPRLPPLPSE